ncbi:MAG TPA: hypothetical protein VFH56_05560, partial [Acidimicrobiales bacterium]|nr:hypothetical protein [Acidimicrobiales bacterium]HEX5596601.1 hypothetical protein [Micromonosporaceae bacterium]
VGSTTYTFSGVTGFTGAGSGNTAFFAGGTGGYTFSGQASNNTLDLSASNSGVSVSLPAGTVSGLSGGDDQFSGITHFVGSGAGGNSFLAGSTDNQTFTGPGNGNTFTAGSGSDSFSSPGVGNTLDFSSVVTSSGSVLRVNLSGSDLPGAANDTAAVGTTTYRFSGIQTFAGATTGHTTFDAPGTSDGYTFHFHGSGDSLDLGELPAGAVVSVPAGTVSFGAHQDSFSGMTGFAGSLTGDTSFVAGASGGYGFTGFGLGNVLDLSAVGAGVSVSVPAGTVSGLGSGGDDSFFGIANFVGSSSGAMMVVAGSSGLAFHGQGMGNALDFSQVTTSSLTPLCINVSGVPVSTASCGTVA